MGYTIFLSRDRETALKRLRDERIDFVFLDLELPDISGFDILQRVKVNRELYHIPIVITSSNNTREKIQKAISLGASEYVLKPYNTLVIKSRIS